jgi:parvulin-like peptidyl-prolyl isomerase
MKRLALVMAALTVLLVFVVAGCGNSIPAGAIATVGDGEVTQQAFDQIVSISKKQAANMPTPQAFPSPGTQQYDYFAAQAVNMLVNQILMKQQGEKLGVSVSAKELNDRMKQFDQQFGGAKKFQQYLDKQGMTMDFAKTLIENQLLTQKIYTKVTSSAKVTDKQMQDYWKAHSKDFQQPATRTVRHILVKTKAEAEKVRSLLEANPSDANWKKVAKQYSIDPGTKDTGGNLGPIRQGMMVPPFDKAAFSLKKDVISQPVKSQYGWHILEVTAMTPGKNVTYEQSKTQIQQMLEAQVKQTAWTSWLNKVTKEANIRYAAGYDPAKLTAPASPQPTAPATTSPTPSPTKS